MRPPFKEILTILSNIIVDILIDDTEAKRFWKANFLGKDHVPWGEFHKQFSAFLRLPLPNPKDLNFACLKKILAEPKADPNNVDPEVVRIEKFGHLLNWFGPLVVDHGGFSVLDKIRSLMMKDWFHGDISKEAAEDLLAGQNKGVFLVRTSFTDKNAPFTISKVSKKGINHQRIHKRPNGTFEVVIKFPNGKVKTEESKDSLLVPFIKSLSSDLSLDTACPGSRYKSLFTQTKVEGYSNDD